MRDRFWVDNISSSHRNCTTGTRIGAFRTYLSLGEQHSPFSPLGKRKLQSRFGVASHVRHAVHRDVRRTHQPGYCDRAGENQKNEKKNAQGKHIKYISIRYRYLLISLTFEFSGQPENNVCVCVCGEASLIGNSLRPHGVSRASHLTFVCKGAGKRSSHVTSFSTCRTVVTYKTLVYRFMNIS